MIFFPIFFSSFCGFGSFSLKVSFGCINITESHCMIASFGSISLISGQLVHREFTFSYLKLSFRI